MLNIETIFFFYNINALNSYNFFKLILFILDIRTIVHTAIYIVKQNMKYLVKSIWSFFYVLLIFLYAEKWKGSIYAKK